MDSGGLPSGPKDHLLFDLVLCCVTLVIMRRYASRCEEDLDGIRSDRLGILSDSLSGTGAQGLCLLHSLSYAKCLQKYLLVVGT